MDALAKLQEQQAFGSGELQSARASTYEPTAIEWLWPNRFAIGKIGIIGGIAGRRQRTNVGGHGRAHHHRGRVAVR
jgi:hypothetical protein